MSDAGTGEKRSMAVIRVRAARPLSTARRRRPRLGSACLGLLVLPVALRDLDVALPPGSPLEWGRSLQAFTPPEKPLFAVTGEKPDDEPHTVTAGRAADTDVRFADSFGLVRVLTWDIAGHLEWIRRTPPGPETAQGLRPPQPRPGDPLHWICLAPLLRLLLHPDAQCPSETLAHLVEIGEPVRGVLGAAETEESLKQACATLRRLIPPDDHVPTPILDGTPRERMLSRFVFEECLRAFPHDPRGEFGKRLLLFPDEVERWLLRYAAHPSLDVRRGAVAALGRLSTPGASAGLIAVAARTDDPVTCVRALAALGRYHARMDVQPLISRLVDTDEPVLRAALVGALGRIGAYQALQPLLALGERALEQRDSDLMISVLSALARFWPPERDRPAVRAFAERVLLDAEHEGLAWAPRTRAAVEADAPDLPTTRADIVRQLAWCVLAAAGPLEEKRLDAFLDLAADGPADPRLVPGAAGTHDPLFTLLPPVRFLYLNALTLVGERGAKRLAQLADERGLEVALRGRALALAPWDQRGEIAARLLLDAAQPTELRIHALEVLLVDRNARATELCRGLVKQLAESPAGSLAAVDRYLYLCALRHLSENGLLRVDDLFALYPHVRAAPAARAAQMRELRGLLAELLAAALDERPSEELARKADEILAFAFSRGLASPAVAGQSTKLRRELLDLMEAAVAQRTNSAFARTSVEQWLLALTSRPSPSADPNVAVFEPVVPLEEELVLALGRTRDGRAAELLLQLVRDTDNGLRAWGCLALGMSRQTDLARQLLPALLDPDPFVRFCAHEGLRHLTGRELDVDWMYGPSDLRTTAAEEYRRWFDMQKR